MAGGCSSKAIDGRVEDISALESSSLKVCMLGGMSSMAIDGEKSSLASSIPKVCVAGGRRSIAIGGRTEEKSS